MDRVPILKLGDMLLVSIQIDLEDHTATALQEDRPAAAFGDNLVVATPSDGDVAIAGGYDGVVAIATDADVSAARARKGHAVGTAPGNSDGTGRSGIGGNVVCSGGGA